MFEEDEIKERDIREIKKAIETYDGTSITILEGIINSRNVNYEYSDKLNERYTPLLDAIEQNKIAVVRFLIQKGADIHSIIEGRDVFALTEDDNIEMLKLLFVEKVCSIARTPSKLDDSSKILDDTLSWALTRYYHLRECLNIPSIFSGETALVHAVDTAKAGRGIDMARSFKKVKLLLQYGADVNALSTDERKPWKIAVTNKRWDIVDLLFKASKHYFYEHKYDPEYIEELKLFVREISKHDENTELKQYFWSIVRKNIDGEVEIGNQKLLLLKTLLDAAVAEYSLKGLSIDRTITDLDIIDKLVTPLISHGSTSHTVFPAIGVWLEELINQINDLIQIQDFKTIAEIVVTKDLTLIVRKEAIIFSREIYPFRGSEADRHVFRDKLLLHINQAYSDHRSFNILHMFYPEFFSEQPRLFWGTLHPFHWRLTIIQERYESLLISPTNFILVLAKKSIFGGTIFYKVTYDKTLGFFRSGFIPIEENDLKILASYYHKNTLITLEEFLHLHYNIISNSRLTFESPVQRALTIISASIKKDDDAEYTNLQLTDLWRDSNISPYLLLPEGAYTKRDIMFMEAVRSVQTEIANILTLYTDLGGKIDELSSKYTRLEHLISKVKLSTDSAITRIRQLETNVHGLTQTMETEAKSQQAPSSTNSDIEEHQLILNENRILVEKQRAILHKNQALYKALSDSFERFSQYPQDHALLEEQISKLSENVRQAAENAQARTEDLIAKLAKLQPFIDNTVALSRIISEAEEREAKKKGFEELDDMQKAFFRSFVKKINAVYLASSAVQTDILSSQKTGFGIDIGSVISNLGSNLPFVGAAASIFGSVISQLDRTYQEKRIKFLYNLAKDIDEMNRLAEDLALKMAIYLKDGTLNTRKLDEPMTLRESLVKVFRIAIEKMDELTSDRTEGAAASISIDSEIKKGEKYASIIVSMLIEAIYDAKARSAEKAEAPDKIQILSEIIIEEYSGELIVRTLEDPQILMEELAALVIKEGRTYLENLGSKHPKREDLFISELKSIFYSQSHIILMQGDIVQFRSKNKDYVPSFITRLVQEFIRLEIFHKSPTTIFRINKFNINKEFKLIPHQFINKITQVVLKLLIPMDSTSSELDSEREDRVIVNFVVRATYDNPILNTPELLFLAKQMIGKGAVTSLVELGEDAQAAEIIIEATRQYGAEHVFKIIFDREKNNLIEESSLTQDNHANQGTIAPRAQETTEFMSEMIADPNTEQNLFLNNLKGIQFIQYVADNFDQETLDKILALGRDFDIAEQILAEAELQGVDKVVYTLLSKEVPEVGSTYNLENIICTDELNQLRLVPNGILNSWSNKAYLKIVEHIDNLAKSLDSMLNVGKSGNQIAIIITLLEEWLNFAASGQGLFHMPYFYHEDHDEDYSYGGRSGSDGENYNNSIGNYDGDNRIISITLPLHNETYNSTDYQM